MAFAITSQPVTACYVRQHEAQYLQKTVIVSALIVNAEPHGVYIADPDQPDNWHCILDIGRMSSARDSILNYVDPLRRPNPVLIKGTLRTEMQTNSWGQRYRSWFIDRMTVLKPTP